MNRLKSIWSNAQHILVSSQVAKNVLWLFADKALRLSLSLLVVVLLARYLGPEQFGTLNYVLALVSIVGVVAALGINGLAVRDLVRLPASASSILGTAICLKLIAAVVGYLVVMVLLWLLDVDSVTWHLGIILACTYLLKSSDVFKYWFESQVQSKYVVIAENSAFFVIVLIKFLLIYLEAPLQAFALAYIGEIALVAAFLRYAYRRTQHDAQPWSFSTDTAVTMLKECWPLIASAAAWIMYSRIDQLMIGQLIDKEAVGYFTVAVRLSEVANMVPAILVMSMIPGIIKVQQDAMRYQAKMQQLYNLTSLLMIMLAVMVFFVADWIIPLLFSAEYKPAAKVLVIQIWAGVFLAMALVSSRYLINEGRQMLLLQRNLLGLGLNVPLNFWFIPKFGIEGAAYASLISVVIASYLFDYFNAFLRPVFFQKTRSLFFLSTIRNLWRNNTKRI